VPEPRFGGDEVSDEGQRADVDPPAGRQLPEQSSEAATGVHYLFSPGGAFPAGFRFGADTGGGAGAVAEAVGVDSGGGAGGCAPAVVRGVATRLEDGRGERLV
jgi:hypothetical protein